MTNEYPMTKRRWYELKRLYVIVGLSLIFVLWFTWESVTTSAAQTVRARIRTAAQNALQVSVYNADRATLIEMLDSGQTFYVPDYNAMDQNGYRNLLNLESLFLQMLNYGGPVPLYRVTSLDVSGAYESVTLSVGIEYPVFGIFTASDSIGVSLPVPHYPYKVK